MRVNIYLKKSVPQLKKIAAKHFHKYIRERDKDKCCISCGRFTTLQAGHFYSAGKHPGLRFNEDNVHGQCVQCNYFLHGALIEYSRNIIDRIGNERFEALKLTADVLKRMRYKWDKQFLIDVIQKYKSKNG